MSNTPLMKHFLFFVVVVFCAISVSAQNCTPPNVVLNNPTNNIFSPEQEMILGDLTYQRILRDLRLVKDPELNSYISKMGERLVQRLPPTGLKFQFIIIDVPEANAFNVPGGYVLLSRKLIAFAKSEDEIAGVIAHELGHAAVRHVASDFSEMLKKVLNVTQVSDRKDIIEKYNLLIERRRTKRISRSSGHNSEQQLEADRIGLYAMVAAGYDPASFASLFDRLAETKGKTGSWFGDLFGGTKPEERRLREMIRATEQLPPECLKRKPAAADEFLKWQAAVVSYRDPNLQEELPGLMWKRDLKPPLQTDISHFAFSPDGKYFLAQDDFAVTVVEREPLRVHVQISAPKARNAEFTPDGKFVIFGTESLRFEKWDVKEKKPVEVRELVVRRDCWEQKFSPDGKYLACIDHDINISVLDTQTGKKLWEKKEFHRLSFFEYLMWALTDRFSDDGEEPLPLFNVEFSPDSRYLVISRSDNFRFTINIDGLSAGSENTTLVLDLPAAKTINAGGDFKKVVQRPYLFLDDKKVVGMGWRGFNEAGIFSFPEGRQIAKFAFGANSLKRTANPQLIVLKARASKSVGVFDLDSASIVAAFSRADVAIWNNLMVHEARSGRVSLTEISYEKGQKGFKTTDVGGLEIPVASIADLWVTQVSDNFRWLALSSKSRGAVWDLTTGERKLFLRGFRAAILGNDGSGVGDFPKLEPVKHSLVVLKPTISQADMLREIPERGARLHGRFVLVRKSLKEDKESEQSSLAEEVRFELRDIVGDKLVWSRDFPKEAPGFFVDEFSGRLILYWTLGSNAGKAKLKEDAALAARAKQLGNKNDDYLLEIVDAFAAKTVGTLLIETGKGSFDIESAFSEGNWLIVRDSENRVLAFSTADGELKHRFFGAKVTLNPAASQIAVENNAGELTLYDLNTGDSQGRFVFKNGTTFARFSLDGKRLLVITDNQTAYAFDLDKARAQPVAIGF